MDISAKVRPIEQDNLYALSDVCINHCIMIRNIRVMKNKDGEMFISMPQVKSHDNWNAIVTLDNRAVRDDITKAILAEYARVIHREVACDENIAVTSISIYETDPASNLKAIVSLNLEGVTINNVRVMEKAGGELWVSMPQYRTKDKQGQDVWYDIVYPSNRCMRDVVTDRVLTAYRDTVQKKAELPDLHEDITKAAAAEQERRVQGKKPRRPPAR